jgi:phosphoglycerate dehydrogenase-like enzyme
MPPLKLLVLNNPRSHYLSALERLPESTHIVVGDSPDIFAPHTADADAIFVGMNQGELLRELLPQVKRARWIHSFSAGVEGLLFPEFLASPAQATNGRGVFARSLGEFVIASALFFAKDLRRMLSNQAAGIWKQFDVEELYGKTMGIVGYGEIGRATARLASTMGMQVIALRRRPELGGDEFASRILPPEAKLEMLAAADYVVVSAPLTKETRGLIGEAELRAMKPEAVIVNVGRGPVITEAALIHALREKWIRGAALDVFDEEPLPAGHPFYAMDNVLLSPHCADHTPAWIEAGMDLFVENFALFAEGKPLRNVIDKESGY